jgi:hypothetical protein
LKLPDKRIGAAAKLTTRMPMAHSDKDPIDCFACGRSVIYRGSRFCSERCREAFDNGLPPHDPNYVRAVNKQPLDSWIIVAGPPGSRIGERYWDIIPDRPGRAKRHASTLPVRTASPMPCDDENTGIRCRQQEGVRQPMKKTATCKQCGNPLRVIKRRGRKRQYCNNKCRVAALRDGLWHQFESGRYPKPPASRNDPKSQPISGTSAGQNRDLAPPINILGGNHRWGRKLDRRTLAKIIETEIGGQVRQSLTQQPANDNSKRKSKRAA